MRAESFSRIVRASKIFLLLAFLCLAAAVLSLYAGRTQIPLGRILRIVFFQDGSVQERTIIFKIRLPRMLMAMLLGGALSLSGFLLQTYFQNPIAGPFVLGISSGAKMAVAFALIVLVPHRFAAARPWLLVAASFIGALLSTSLILLVSGRLHHNTSLLVVGIMIGYITSAVTDLLITFANDADIVNLHSWSTGSFSGMSMDDFSICAMLIIPALVLTFLLAKPIGAYRLGESYAQSMGVNVRLFRPLLILLSSLLSSCVTAFAGPVSFVGIAVPFLVKQCMGSAEPLLLIPACFIGGAAFCSYCDLAARLLLAPLEMNLSTITSFFGAPVVIYMLVRRHSGGKL
ncbi:MAG TPA: iron ABC transporter permease [Treponema sp.]|nr:iron ABC transporter permease [Treponema sp.]